MDNNFEFQNGKVIAPGSDIKGGQVAETINNYNYPEGTRKIPHALTSPPFLPEVFVGRKDELQTVKERLFKGSSILFLVNGDGGIGKTTLASRYYHEYQGEYAHVAWVLGDKSIRNAFLTLSEPLGIKFEADMPEDKRLELLLRYMAELNKPCLLVIDNANELEDLEKNYTSLRCCHNFHILLTTRITEFQSVEYFKVEGLPEDKALELFKKHYPEHLGSEDALFKKIHKAVGGNTLVIELLAKNLHLFNRLRTKYTLSDLLSDLRSRGLLAISQSGDVSTDYHAYGNIRKEKPEDIISAMYDIGQLSLEEIALLSAFAVLPAESIRFEIIEILLGSTDDLDKNLMSLAQKGWIEYKSSEKCFKCSPVIQEIVKKKNPKLFEDCKALISVLINRLDYEVVTGHFVNSSYEEAATFSNYAESVLHSISKQDEDISILCERVGSYNNTTGNLDKALGYFEECMRLTKELYEACPNNVSFKNGLVVLYERLGSTHTSLGNLDKALGYFEEYMRLSKELYEAYPNNVSFKNGLAISYEKLGETHTSLGNLDKAFRYFEEDMRLSKELYEAYPNNVSFKDGLAISYSKLGDTHTSLGNLDKALGYFEEEMRLSKELYEAYPNNVSFKNSLAISYEKLGDTHTSLGNLDKALGYFEEYMRLKKELYEAYPNNVSFKNGLAISYLKLGVTHTLLGNLDKVLGYFEEYMRLIKELYIAYPNNVSFKNDLSVSYSKLGETHTSFGNLDKALGYFEEDMRLTKELYEAYPNNVSFKNGLAISYYKLGDFYRNNNLGEFSSYFFKAEKLWAELVADAPQYVKFQRFLNQVRKDIAKVSAAKEKKKKGFLMSRVFKKKK